MRTIKLQVEDSVYSHIIFLLKNLRNDGIKILEDIDKKEVINKEMTEIKAMSNHSANLIDEWKNESEDEIWK